MNITILGSGPFGLALFYLLSKNNKVVIWTNSEEEKAYLIEKKVSPKLPSYKIPDNIEITTDLKYSIKNSNIIIFALPAFAIRSVSEKLTNLINENHHLIIASKGIENDSCMFLSEILKENMHTSNIGVLSGPTFAKDIVENAIIGFTLATDSETTYEIIKSSLKNTDTKLEKTNDMVGVEICGAIKNVMAIASGILNALNPSASTKAMFLTQILCDIKELIVLLGGKEKTILTYSGVGDIIMTSTSENSRNFSYGKLIGEGKKDEAKKYSEINNVEGLYSLKSVKQILLKKNKNISIINLVEDIILGKKEASSILSLD